MKNHETETEVLPVILLGICADWREDLNPTSAELVLAEPIRLSKQFPCK